ncbi:T-cell receptor beta chain V region CTL-F3 [Collichthys lucidus]|nr:T-cell receptor beta chain V region CTL-F3 [Collichthys lucidus]
MLLFHKSDKQETMLVRSQQKRGASNTSKVLQTPDFIIKRTGDSVASGINCSHNITMYDVILWYKQDRQGALKFLGYQYATMKTLEDDVKGKISFDGNGNSHSSLTIFNLLLEDSAVYLCAASRHSAADSFNINTKTLICLQADSTFTLLNTCNFHNEINCCATEMTKLLTHFVTLLKRMFKLCLIIVERIQLEARADKRL